MMKNIGMILFAGILLMGAVPPTDYKTRLSQIVMAYSRKIEKERGLYTGMIGGGMPDDIRRFGVSLHARYTLPLEEARRLYVELFEELKAVINHDPYIRPLLCEFPYPNQGIDLTLGFEPCISYISVPDKTDIYSILSVNGILYYYDFSRNTIFEEPYEAALKLVQKNENRAISEESLNIFASEVLPTIPLSSPPKKTYVGPDYSIETQKAFDQFTNTVAEQKKWDYLREGSTLLIKGEKTEWSALWASNEQVHLDQARKMALQLRDQMWTYVNQNPVFVKDLKAYAKHCKELNYRNYRDLETHLKPYMIGFRIDFWDQNTNRYKAPYLAQIRLADDKLYFHYADPETQALQKPIVETIKMAYKKHPNR